MSETDVRVLGIEGTAWAASAAVYDSATDTVEIETEAYLPDSGGLHPREAAEHMAEHLPEVIERIIEDAREEYGEEPFDCVAFSRGPGLGPCLRLVGTSARAVAQRFDVPLVGVNHMVAHLEIGRHFAGFDAPVCLNASGANAHLLGYRAGRYRVLGETMDTGVGNSLDKFTRYVGWSHPGGPKVEEAAKDGEYIDLPYVVKGMDFSFSGIMSAAKQEYDDGTPVEDICCGLQETIFAMLTEVSERALALTGSEELVLGGGVGQNDRLREMLASMCDQRGAEFFAPENRFLRDNAGMIAVLGAKMYDAGQTIPIAESGIDSDFRPDQVEVTWRPPETTVRREREEFVQGAESAVTIADETVEKHRHRREYRHPELDERLRRERTRQEARLLHEARREGVPTPLIRDVDTGEMRLTLQRVGERDLQDGLTADRVGTVAEQLAALHDAGVVHGDPTPRNVRVGDRPFLIDFGLGYYSDDPEDHAMDLHVLLGSLAGIDDNVDRLRTAVIDAYRASGDEAVLDQLREIEGRGRYQ
ncbi:bifunctional N(6)-L-threonylcarbamoyladenine synthase/serine/threonine protein kinase [Halovenus sp. HT40]|uniref:bifunctional N(6)-L-threonylcarbamoyladenine synthase/serine/threonine protein kinase n=1 Tax=Halovenus sp. HT40 TaxID=3126691 RepID=UPI00300EEECF